MNIGAVSRATGCNIETIRYYERIGLLGKLPRTASGYRRFDSTAVERLRFVVKARELGFTVDEVRSLVDLSGKPVEPCAEVEDVAHRLLDRTRRKIGELERLADSLQGLLAGCRHDTRASCTIVNALKEE